MTLADLLQATRNLLRDTHQAKLYSDDELVLYLNDAQNKLALRTHSFVIADSPLGLVDGVDLYPLSTDIISVYSCTLDGYYGRLRRSTEVWMPDGLTEAKPSGFSTDKETQAIRFYPIPDQEYTAILRVAKLPTALTLEDTRAECDVRPHWQIALCDWAAYRCFSIDDADGRNDNSAKLAKQRFDAAINEIKCENYQAKTGPSARARGNRIK